MRPHIVAVLASVAASVAATSFVACSSDINVPCAPPPQVSTVTAAQACAVVKASKKVGTGYAPGDGYVCTFDEAFSKLLPPSGSARDDTSPADADAGGASDGSASADASDDARDGGDASANTAPDASADGGTGFVCPDYTAPITKTCTFVSPCGRPYEGYVSEPVGPSAHAYLVSCMAMEAASVAAFHVLEHDLRALGAPESLLRACRAAANDEVRHAETMAHLVGEVPSFPDVAPRGRTTLEIALENARIGMVRETYGAVVAKVQGTRAASPALRDVWSTIGDDELGHAGLAWEIGAFLSTCLDANERAAVASAMRDEVAALSAELSEPPSREHLEVGVPDVATARGIVAALRDGLWERSDLAA